jgi:ribosome biogenesis GTPase A
VHPSVYLLLFFHTCSLTPLDERENKLQKSLAAYERKMLGVKEGLVTDYGFWAASDPARAHMSDERSPIRALVCGDAGVGKSKLINKVSGVSSLVRKLPSPDSKALLIADNSTGRTFRP